MTDKLPLYLQIGEAIRQQILDGVLRPGDLLPPIREMAEQWGCTSGTVQQAYKTLARQGLIVSRPGQGTRVGAALPPVPMDRSPVRRAALVHQAEAFLLEALSAGYTPGEADAAFRAALDRWRALAVRAAPSADQTVLRFAGSHDLAVSLLATRFPQICAGCSLEVVFPGSLGGLIALAEGKADLAGCHLWDAESDTYNVPFVRRLLPGQRVALVTLAHRRLGLIAPPGNPLGLARVEDLAREGLRFINRQRGAGTRVWLDAQLHSRGLSPEQIAGYADEVATHSEVARAVAEGRADVGMGVEAAALAYALDFVLLATERYDLVLPAEVFAAGPARALVDWLASAEGRAAIAGLGGYETDETGRVMWVE
ncbi:MAG: HTH-type transcriptional repressor YvoA [Chloroflexi bacterium ADurb.Bin325]|nr:MAG: HTH-type transcriptional repressor YvoA [Chloroflexi bacterium ADurb.Bin325]